MCEPHFFDFGSWFCTFAFRITKWLWTFIFYIFNIVTISLVLFPVQIFNADHINTFFSFLMMSDISVERCEGSCTSQCQDIGFGTFSIPTSATLVNPPPEGTGSADGVLAAWDDDWDNMMLKILLLTIMIILMFREHDDYFYIQTQVKFLLFLSK